MVPHIETCIAHTVQEKLNEAIMVLNKSLQEINVQNMNVELVAQMFKNYQSNVLFHLEGGAHLVPSYFRVTCADRSRPSHGQSQRRCMRRRDHSTV
jgi:hypothetical protein